MYAVVGGTVKVISCSQLKALFFLTLRFLEHASWMERRITLLPAAAAVAAVVVMLSIVTAVGGRNNNSVYVYCRNEHFMFSLYNFGIGYMVEVVQVGRESDGDGKRKRGTRELFFMLLVRESYR